MRADGPIDPMPWFDFGELVAQSLIALAVLFGVAWGVLLYVRAWRVQARTDAALDARANAAWLERLEPLQGQPEPVAPVDTPGGAWSVPGTIDRGHPDYANTCPDCRHPIRGHVEKGVCSDPQCLAMGYDQVCPSTVTLINRYSRGSMKINWGSPINWVMFCRNCGHRMAHHDLLVDGMFECPPGPQGPFHDGLIPR